MVEKGASDLHITTGSPPQLRIDGSVVPLKLPPLARRRNAAALLLVLTEEQKIKLRARLRARPLVRREGPRALPRNIFMQRGARRAAPSARSPSRSSLRGARACPPSSPSSPRTAARPRARHRPTGSGKSTTLASIIDKINSETRQHIVTIEDPIEYLHPHKLSVVNQREVGPTRTRSRTRSSTSCARTRTSCSSARCATSRRSRRRSPSPRRATWSSARSTPTRRQLDQPHDRRVPAHQQRRSARSSRSSSRASCRSCCCRARTGRAACSRRGDGPQPRHPEPHPRGQDPPDLLADAGGPGQGSGMQTMNQSLYALRAPRRAPRRPTTASQRRA
jgi:hypothetical protein